MGMTIMRRTTQRGFTFAELLVGSALLVVGIGTLMFGMHYTSLYAGYLHDEQMAMHEAQGVLEQLSSAGVKALSGATLLVVLEPSSPPATLINLASARTGQEVPTLSFLNNGKIAIQVRQPATPDVFDISVAACWTYR